MEGNAAGSPSLGQMVKDTPKASPAPASLNVRITISPHKEKLNESEEEEEDGDDAQRGQWLRAAVLGANDGLVTTASLMTGVGGVKKDPRFMVLSGLGALVAGACSMAVGEYVSVQTQRDVELCSLKRKKRVQQEIERSTSRTLSPSSGTTDMKGVTPRVVISSSEKEKLPNPAQAACASGLSFTVGALVPLLSAAFITDDHIRLGVLIGVFSMTLLSFGALGAYLGGASVVKGSLRVLIGGWIAMSITVGVLKLFQRTEARDDS